MENITLEEKRLEVEKELYKHFGSDPAYYGLESNIAMIHFAKKLHGGVSSIYTGITPVRLDSEERVEMLEMLKKELKINSTYNVSESDIEEYLSFYYAK